MSDRVIIFNQQYIFKKNILLFSLISGKYSINHKNKIVLMMSGISEPQPLYNYSQNIDLSDMPSELSYFLIVPLTAQEAKDQKNHNIVPIPIVYKKDTTKISQIIQDLYQEEKKYKDKYISLTLSSGYMLENHQEIRQVLKMLGREANYVLTLFVEVHTKPIKLKSINPNYDDECCVTDYLEQNEFISTKHNFTLWIEIPLKNKSQMFSLSIHPDQSGEVLRKRILESIQQKYNKQIDKKEIESIKIQQLLKKKIDEQKKILDMEKPLKGQTIYNQSHLILILKNYQQISLTRIKKADHNDKLIILKEGEKEAKTFKYSDISQLTFEEFYKSPDGLGFKEEEIPQNTFCCLKIMDLIIKPDEKISKAEDYFKNQNPQIPLEVVGRVVTQKIIFYNVIPDLHKNNPSFSIEQEANIADSQKTTMEICRQKGNQRAKMTTNEHFKIAKNLEPIMIYTSEVKCKQNGSENLKSIYSTLNEHLRNTKLFTLEGKDIKNSWKYMYTSVLLNHLEKILSYQGFTYRGVNYNPKLEIGNKITFKSFLSTSTDENIAKSSNFSKVESKSNSKHIFKLNILKGYPIWEYSYSMSEKEVLLPPFSYFEVKNISKIVKESHKQIIYELQEIQTSRLLPQVKANFVVWIDDHPKQGRQIFDKINIPKETTFLTQLLSTEKLIQWLRKNQDLFKDKTANLIFISDISRKEGDHWNSTAGIEGLREIRKYDPNRRVFFYTGNKRKKTDFLRENGVDINTVEIGDKPDEIKKYLEKQIGLNK